MTARTLSCDTLSNSTKTDGNTQLYIVDIIGGSA